MSNQISDKLDKILKLNEALRRQAAESSACIAQLSAKVESLQANIDLLKSEGVCSSSETLKVPRVLSAKVKALHATSELQFDGKQQFNAVHNENVTTFLKEQLTEKYKDQFSKRVIHRAIYRYYESRRRILMDMKSERKEQVLKNKLSTKKYLRKKRTYEAREKHLKQTEKQYWKDVPIEAMSSEDEGSETDVLYRHSPAWRSDNLNKLIRKIDTRIQRKSKTSFQKKQRVSGALRHHGAPPGLPKWMIKPSTRTEQHTDNVNSVEMLDVPDESLDLSVSSGTAESILSSPSVNHVPHCSTPQDHRPIHEPETHHRDPLESLEEIPNSECRPQLQVEMSSSTNGNNRTPLSSTIVTTSPSRRGGLAVAGEASLEPLRILHSLDDELEESSDSSFEL